MRWFSGQTTSTPQFVGFMAGFRGGTNHTDRRKPKHPWRPKAFRRFALGSEEPNGVLHLAGRARVDPGASQRPKPSPVSTTRAARKNGGRPGSWDFSGLNVPKTSQNFEEVDAFGGQHFAVLHLGEMFYPGSIGSPSMCTVLPTKENHSEQTPQHFCRFKLKQRSAK